MQSGETLVLGGLISENKTQSNSGIPFLKDIPVLGALFSATTDNAERQELMVLMTPRAVRDQAEARAVTEEFRHRLRELEVDGRREDNGQSIDSERRLTRAILFRGRGCPEHPSNKNRGARQSDSN